MSGVYGLVFPNKHGVLEATPGSGGSLRGFLKSVVSAKLRSISSGIRLPL